MARQARTTENLKERMADALIELLSEKPYAEISVGEITDRADVGRATYYRHFVSKDDVLMYKFAGIFEHRKEDSTFAGKPADWVRSHFALYLENIIARREVFEAVYAAELDYLLFMYLYRQAVSAVEDETLITRYRTALHSASVFAVVDQWITSGFSQSPEELTDMLLHQMRPEGKRPQCKDGEDGAGNEDGGADSPEE